MASYDPYQVRLDFYKCRAFPQRYRPRFIVRALDPNACRRLVEIGQRERAQAAREMTLESRESVDQQQMTEMNLHRSLALDSREKLLRQREAELKSVAKQQSRR